MKREHAENSRSGWLQRDSDRLCGLVVRVFGYRSGGPGSIPGTTRFSGGGGKENSSGSGTGPTQPREYKTEELLDRKVAAPV
jgi:hypothetical protein